METIFIVEKTNVGYSAFASNLSVYSAGPRIEKLKENCLEALNLYNEETGLPEVTETDLIFDLDEA